MKRNYWLHRISHERGLSNVLLEKRNELSIGFSDFSDNKSLNRILSNPDEIEAVMQEGWGRIISKSFFFTPLLMRNENG